jgi:hypothetical protein
MRPVESPQILDNRYQEILHACRREWPQYRPGRMCMDHQKTIDHHVEWATSEENIRAVVLTGSGALGGPRFDGLSDLDVDLYVLRPSELLDERSWYEAFGEVLVVEALPNPGWHPTRLIYFVDGKIDFTLVPAAALADATYTRPFRVLVDKDQLTEHLRVTSRPTDEPPSDEEFLECALVLRRRTDVRKVHCSTRAVDGESARLRPQDSTAPDDRVGPQDQAWG